MPVRLIEYHSESQTDLFGRKAKNGPASCQGFLFTKDVRTCEKLMLSAVSARCTWSGEKNNFFFLNIFI